MSAPGLRFIRDTIYSLKREYGLTIAVGAVASALDLKSGIKTATYSVLVVKRAILLPTSMYAQFMQTLTGGTKVGTIEKNTRKILIDKQDIRAFDLNRECFVGYSGNALNWRSVAGVDWNNLAAWNQAHSTQFIRTDVKNVEDLLYAVTLTVQETNGLTII
jgi:hypothetical protein